VSLPGGRDSSEIEALVTDRYLDALLSGPTATPPGTTRNRAPDDDLRSVADRLLRLPRVHPSFRFEEALSARLTAAALAGRLPAAAGAEGSVIAIRGDAAAVATDPELAAYVVGATIDDDEDRVNPLLLGGALTSAALSLAGAAYVAWRLRRPVGTPMARAIRAVSRTRPT
jgi:hypothetical protein